MIISLCIAAAIFFLTVWKPSWGVSALALLWPAYLIRFSVLQVPTTALELGVYAAALAVAIRLMRGDISWRPLLPNWRWAALLAAWVIGWGIACVAAADHRAAFGAAKAWLVDPLIYAGLLRVTILTVRDRMLTVWGAVSSGVIVSLAGLIQMAWFRGTLQDGRLSSFFHPVANFAAMFLVPLLVIAVVMSLYRGWKPVTGWITVLIIAAAVALTVSFGGFMSLGVGLIVAWMFLPAGRQKRNIAIAAFGAAFLTFSLLWSSHYFNEHFQAGRSSGEVRHQIWASTVKMIEDHPLTGVGPNNFQPAYRAIVPVLFWPPLEWDVAKAHNLYLNLWAETGPLTLVSFLVIMGAWCWALPRAWRDPQRRVVVIAAFAALMAILVHGLVDTPYFKNDLSMEFVFVMLLPWIGSRR